MRRKRQDVPRLRNGHPFCRTEEHQVGQSAYMTGKTPFLSLIEAERGLIDLRGRYYEVLSDHYRRQTALERVIGGTVGDETPGAIKVHSDGAATAEAAEPTVAVKLNAALDSFQQRQDSQHHEVRGQQNRMTLVSLASASKVSEVG